ncbi:MAG: hypothetical protein WDZ28_01305 [Simkaniaceae bacterium]
MSGVTYKAESTKEFNYYYQNETHDISTFSALCILVKDILKIIINTISFNYFFKEVNNNPVFFNSNSSETVSVSDKNDINNSNEKLPNRDLNNFNEKLPNRDVLEELGALNSLLNDVAKDVGEFEDKSKLKNKKLEPENKELKISLFENTKILIDLSNKVYGLSQFISENIEHEGESFVEKCAENFYDKIDKYEAKILQLEAKIQNLTTEVSRKNIKNMTQCEKDAIKLNRALMNLIGDINPILQMAVEKIQALFSKQGISSELLIKESSDKIIFNKIKEGKLNQFNFNAPVEISDYNIKQLAPVFIEIAKLVKILNYDSHCYYKLFEDLEVKENQAINNRN